MILQTRAMTKVTPRRAGVFQVVINKSDTAIEAAEVGNEGILEKPK